MAHTEQHLSFKSRSVFQ